MIEIKTITFRIEELLVIESFVLLWFKLFSLIVFNCVWKFSSGCSLATTTDDVEDEDEAVDEDVAVVIIALKNNNKKCF